jgi:hypothetical protein
MFEIETINEKYLLLVFENFINLYNLNGFVCFVKCIQEPI